jgi:hypothetical protein
VGVHGKRTGSWSGKKQYLLCAHCHDPHQPHFKPLKPLPPPVRPADLKAGMAAPAPVVVPTASRQVEAGRNPGPADEKAPEQKAGDTTGTGEAK